MPKRIYTLEAKKKKTSPPVTDDSNPSENQPFNTLGYLHDAIGNQQIQQLYSEGRIQPLLKANQPYDSYEIEANRVASLLASGSRSDVEVKERTIRPGLFAKLISAPGKMKKKQEDQELVAEKIKNLSPARELAPEDQEFYGSRFDQDFEKVRLHTGPEAEQMTEAIGARAFTLDNHIVMGKDQPGPETAEGQELLAHELTHVVQQAPKDKAAAESETATGEAARTKEGKDQEKTTGKAPADDKELDLTAEKDEAQAEKQTQTVTAGEPQDEAVPPAEEQVIATTAPAAEDAGQIPGDTPTAVPEEPGQPSPSLSRESNCGGGSGASLDGGVVGSGGGGSLASEELVNEAPSLTADNSTDLLASVSQAPGSKMLSTFNRVVGASDAMLQQESQSAAESLPVIKAPSGLPEAETTVGMKVKAPTFNLVPPDELKAGTGSQGTEAAVADQLPDFTGKQSFTRTNAALSQMPEDKATQAVQTEKAIANVQLDGEQVPASLGTPPTVSLTGSADPARMSSSQTDAQENLNRAQESALSITGEDFGENNIFPEKDETLIQAKTELKTKQLALEKEATDKLPAVPSELTAEVDKEMAKVMKPQLTEQEAKYATAEAQYEKDAATAHADNEARVAQLEDETRAAQAQTQAQAQAEIEGHKSDFQAETARVDAEFKENSQAASSEYQAKVSEEKEKGEVSASRHFSEAEKKADAEKGKAESKVAAEKAKAKEEKKSLWDNICDAVSSFVDKLKSAVSAIFEGLRALVKGIFEIAKKLALAAIDAARAAITGLIKVFGAVLKGFIKIAFAAFPKLQKALLDKVDQAINKALDAVNKFADMLKKGVAALFDILAKVIDTLLGMVQAAYEAALEAIKFIVRGEFGELAKYIFKAALRIIGTGLKEFMALLGIDTSALDKIIEDPIGFLKNLISAVKGGVGAFVKNIVPHLTNGMASWLFGTFQGAAGIMLPQSFDLSGMLFFLLQLFNLTWASLRGQIVKEMGPDGEATMSAAEKGVDFITELVTKGPLAIVEHIKDFVGNIKDTFFGAIIEWLRNTLIIKGIEKLIMFLNPAGAILAAVQAIYNIVKFFIERWDQIKSFCQAVMNSIKEIAGGSIGTAVGWIEQSLARFIPVTLGFLANFIGLGGIVDKIKGVIQKIRAPIDKAVGKAVGFIAKKIKNSKIFKKLKGFVDKGKKKVQDWKDKRKAKKEAKQKAREEKEKNKKEKAEELDGDDRKQHKKYADEIAKELKKDDGTPEESFEVFYKRKQELAASLETAYQSRLKRGINLDIKLESLGAAKKDNDISITVKIAPNDTVETVTVEKEGAASGDLEKEIANAHPGAIGRLKKAFKEEKEKFSKDTKWDEAKKILSANKTVAKMINNPLSTAEHDFGKAVYAEQAVPAATTAIKNTGEKDSFSKEKGFTPAEIVDNSKKDINARKDPFVKSKGDLTEFIFNNGQAGTVLGTLTKEFEGKIKLDIENDVNHKWFFPAGNIIPKDIGGGNTSYTYTTRNGATFTATVNKDELPTKMEGKNLCLHDLGRGITENPKTGKPVRHDSSHLIANLFGGSGDKRGFNLTAASAKYNQIHMKQAETLVKDYIKSMMAKYDVDKFNMEVQIEYGELAPDDVIAVLYAEILKLPQAKKESLKLSDIKNEAELKTLILNNLKDFQGKLMRIMSVSYTAWFEDETGKIVGGKKEDFEPLGPDIWFGV